MTYIALIMQDHRYNNPVAVSFYQILIMALHDNRHVNARLKLARVHSAQGRGLPTAAGRGCSHTTRAHRDTDANFHARFFYRSAAHASGRFGG